MATFHFSIKDTGVLAALSPSKRLNVLMALYTHANIRMRCWPSIQRICKVAGVAPATATKAIQWLEQTGAIEKVSHDKRVGPETQLPPRQSVYQLTGVITIDGKQQPYLYTGNGAETPAHETAKASEVTQDEISHGETEVNPYVTKRKETSTKSLEDTPPTNTQLAIDALKRYIVAAVFNGKADDGSWKACSKEWARAGKMANGLYWKLGVDVDSFRCFAEWWRMRPGDLYLPASYATFEAWWHNTEFQDYLSEWRHGQEVYDNDNS